MKKLCFSFILFTFISCATPKLIPQFTDLTGNYGRTSTHETLTLNADRSYVHTLLDSESRAIVSSGKWVYREAPTAADMKRESENVGASYSYGKGRAMITFYSWISSSSLKGVVQPAMVWFENGSLVIQPLTDSSIFSKN